MKRYHTNDCMEHVLMPGQQTLRERVAFYPGHDPVLFFPCMVCEFPRCVNSCCSVHFYHKMRGNSVCALQFNRNSCFPRDLDKSLFTLRTLLPQNGLMPLQLDA